MTPLEDGRNFARGATLLAALGLATFQRVTPGEFWESWWPLEDGALLYVVAFWGDLT